MLKIQNIKAIEILDSNGDPTIQVEVRSENGYKGLASVPSGNTIESFESVELRDGDKSRYFGKGVQKAVENINKKIAKKLIGMNIYNQKRIDKEMIILDGTPNKSNLGANAILGVSLAVAKCAANSLDMELYRYLGGLQAQVLPTPMVNILSGGKHSDNNISIQEFMIMPVSAISFREALRCGAEIFHSLKSVLKSKNMNTAVGDEGGFAPNLKTNEEAIQIIIEAIEKAGYKPNEDVKIAIDAAASEFYDSKTGKYNFTGEGVIKTADELVDYYEMLCDKYPIISIEDGFAEDDWDGWKKLTERIGDRVQLVGDDLFVTNTKRLAEGIEKGIGN